MNNPIVDIISVIGSAASVFGICFAIWQLSKVLKAARAAEKATLETQAKISKNVLLSEISTCARYVEELKTLIRDEHHEGALLRVNDLNAQLIQIHNLNISVNDGGPMDLTKAFANTGILRGQLEKVSADKTSIKISTTNAKLSEIGDMLNEYIGKQKYLVRRKDDHD